MTTNLAGFFNPNNIAIIGASNDPVKPGNTIINNLIKIGFPGQIFPVNPREEKVMNLKCFPSLEVIPQPTDLVVIITPAPAIAEIMAQIRHRMQKWGDIKAIVCAAAGFAETGSQEGHRYQTILKETARELGIRVMGPNCIGIIDNVSKVDTTFVETLMPPSARGQTGGLSFISQSGAVAASLLMWGASQPVPLRFNKFISIGNMVDVDFIDLLDYLEADDQTKVIAMYLEGYPRADHLIRTMGRVAKRKPVLVLKVGASQAGAEAAGSHTGSLAGEDTIFSDLFRQFGIIRVESMEELMDTMQAFAAFPLPQNNKTFILTQAGGPGIIATDMLATIPQLQMAHIKAETKAKMKSFLLPFANVCLPEGFADITASASVSDHLSSLEALMDDPEVQAIIFITVVPTFLPRQELGEQLSSFLKLRGREKPVLPVIMAGNWVLEVRRTIEESGYITFPTPERAVRALGHMVTYAGYKKVGG